MARKKMKTNAKETTAVSPAAETTTIALSDGVEFEMPVRMPSAKKRIGFSEIMKNRKNP